jgi:Rieske Fe-S protein
LIALAACSSSSTGNGTSASSPPPAKPGEALLQLADIKVGESAAADLPSGDPILISRTADGTVVAFSAICTHKGCTVNPAGKELHCPCHGSKFDAATGKVIGGPAPSPLAKVDVHITNGAVVTGR